MRGTQRRRGQREDGAARPTLQRRAAALDELPELGLVVAPGHLLLDPRQTFVEVGRSLHGCRQNRRTKLSSPERRS